MGKTCITCLRLRWVSVFDDNWILQKCMPTCTDEQLRMLHGVGENEHLRVENGFVKHGCGSFISAQIKESDRVVMLTMDMLPPLSQE